VRQLVCILVLFLLAGCRSAPSSHPTTVVDSKTAPKKGQIKAGDFFASPENCGLIHDVRPVYPKDAKRAGIQGDVKLNIIITKTGEVGELHLVSGNTALAAAAIEAVKQWRFAPCRLNGEPVAVKTQIDVPFNLNQ
jgi:periplasmic protein TonB